MLTSLPSPLSSVFPPYIYNALVFSSIPSIYPFIHSFIHSPMASSSSAFVLLLFVSLAALDASANVLRMDIHHRFSDRVRRWTESNSRQLPGGWPEKHTAEYYAALAAHDRGRFLAEDQEVTYSSGNATVRISILGFLYYGFVDLGTPNTTFMVALDTGSDLFWVPCECKSCAPTKAGSDGFTFDFSVYNLSSSSTSKVVPCNSSSCRHHDRCSGDGSACPYYVEYVSANTSTAGFLVEDLLYLTTEDTNPKVVTAPITFGCGRNQTGSFLESAAPNGLFGLGMDNISVPSTLSSEGITSNSFSMCFGSDGIGRISFGDNGSSDQEETPFNIKNSDPTYNILLTGISLGNSSMNVSFSAIVDSGTSFTILADPVYTSLTKAFNAQVHDRQYTAASNLPFEFCYYLRSNLTQAQSPDLSFTTKGGSKFPIGDPYIYATNDLNQTIYCLAVIQSDQLNIIGENFMTGLRIVFDRERMMLGWKEFNCYDVEETNPLPVNPPQPSALPPSIAVGPSSFSPAATKNNGNQNGSGATVVPPGAASSCLSLESSFITTILVFLVLPLAII